MVPPLPAADQETRKLRAAKDRLKEYFTTKDQLRDDIEGIQGSEPDSGSDCERLGSSAAICKVGRALS